MRRSVVQNEVGVRLGATPRSEKPKKSVPSFTAKSVGGDHVAAIQQCGQNGGAATGVLGFDQFGLTSHYLAETRPNRVAITVVFSCIESSIWSSRDR
jgi:hypothetical protein